MSNLDQPLGGGLTPIDAVIEMAKSDCPNKWSRYCELAQKLAQQSGQTGLSREDAARKRLAGDGTVDQQQIAAANGWESFNSQLRGGPAKPPSEFQMMFSEAQRLEQLFRIQLASALQLRRYFLTGFDANLKPITVPLILIKPDQFRFDSDEMLLGDGLKIFGVRIASVDPQTLAAQNDRPGRKPGQQSAKDRACMAALSILSNDDERPPRGYGRRAELARRVRAQLQSDGQNYQEDSVQKMIRDTVAHWEAENPDK
jgi:hypothetical protein